MASAPSLQHIAADAATAATASAAAGAAAQQAGAAAARLVEQQQSQLCMQSAAKSFTYRVRLRASTRGLGSTSPAMLRRHPNSSSSSTMSSSISTRDNKREQG
ncbi:hypothetical protein ACSSS7_005220 [Eimeria intestinalis]